MPLFSSHRDIDDIRYFIGQLFRLILSFDFIRNYITLCLFLAISFPSDIDVNKIANIIFTHFFSTFIMCYQAIWKPPVSASLLVNSSALWNFLLLDFAFIVYLYITNISVVVLYHNDWYFSGIQPHEVTYVLDSTLQVGALSHIMNTRCRASSPQPHFWRYEVTWISRNCAVLSHYYQNITTLRAEYFIHFT